MVKKENVMDDLTNETNDHAVQSVQGQPEGCEGAGCSAPDAGESVGNQGNASPALSKKGKKDLMIRLPLGVAVLRDPAFNQGTAFTAA